jgi:hypothetical protein
MIALTAPEIDSDVGEAPLDAGPLGATSSVGPETADAASDAEARAHADAEAAAPGATAPELPAWSLAAGDPETIDLETLGDEIATLAAHIHAATYRLLVLIRAFDEREGWGGGGFRSCAHWLSWRTGISLGPCRERVRVAHALAELPRISEAMARGEMSFSKVRAISRVAKPANEEELLNVARHAPASHLERLVRAWRRVDSLEAAQEEAERHRRRHVELWPAEDGSWVLRARLDPEVGTMLQSALEWAGEALYRRDAATAVDTGEEEASAEQRWADALGLVVERAMVQRTLDEGGVGTAGAAGASADESRFSSGGSLDTSGEAREPRTEPGSDEPWNTPEGEEAPPPLGRPDRFLVLVHVDAATLQRQGTEARADRADGDHAPAAETCGCETSEGRDVSAETCGGGKSEGRGVSAERRGGEKADHRDVSAETCGGGKEPNGLPPLYPQTFHPETARRLACDAVVRGILHGPEGEVLDVGRRRRTIPPALRLALEVRFGGRCCFPGCTCRYVEGHHAEPWAQGGETKLSNIFPACRVHHRALHEGGFRMEVGEDGEPRFFRPDGQLIPPAPPPPPLPAEPVEELVETHAQLGIRPDAWTPTPHWWGESLDLPWAVDVLRAVGRDEPGSVESAGAGPVESQRSQPPAG